MDGSERKKILLIEDNRAHSDPLKQLLQGSGYEVLSAGNGADGLRKARAEAPGLILSDVRMPVMDGYELCRELKRDEGLKEVPVILLTHLSDPKDVIKGLNCGADGYITKPFDSEFLLSSIRNFISEAVHFVNNPEDKRIEVTYGGSQYEIYAGRAQTLGFLLATYENAVIQNKELHRVQEELKSLNELLEYKVRERTAALTAEVSERKAAEQALKDTDERFRALVEAASDAVICLEPPDNIYIWNRKAEEMFGYGSEEVIGRGLHAMIVPEQYRAKAFAALEKFFKSGEGDMIGKTVEVMGLRRNGDEFPAEVSLSSFNIKGTWNAIGIIRDITRRKTLERDLKQNINDLERFNRLMVGRELKMEELRDEVRVLRGRVKELEASLDSSRQKTGL